MITLHLKNTPEAKEAFTPLFKELDSKAIEYRLKDYETFITLDCDQLRGFIGEMPIVKSDLSIDYDKALVCTCSPVGSERIEWHYISLKFISNIMVMN